MAGGFFSFFLIYLLVYLTALGLSCSMRDLGWVTRDLFVAACGLSCGMWDLVP